MNVWQLSFLNFIKFVLLYTTEPQFSSLRTWCSCSGHIIHTAHFLLLLAISCFRSWRHTWRAYVSHQIRWSLLNEVDDIFFKMLFFSPTDCWHIGRKVRGDFVEKNWYSLVHIKMETKFTVYHHKLKLPLFVSAGDTLARSGTLFTS